MKKLRNQAGYVGLTLVAAAFVFVLFPVSRDATHGIVSIHLWSEPERTLYLVKYKVVIQAQSVVELRQKRDKTGSSVQTYGFKECAVFDRRNWRCERVDSEYFMRDGLLNINVTGQGYARSQPNQPVQINRLQWWIRRLALSFH